MKSENEPYPQVGKPYVPATAPFERPMESRIVLNPSALKAGGAENIRAFVDGDGKIVIEYNLKQLPLGLFNFKDIEKIGELIGDEDTEHLVTKAQRLIDRGIMISLLFR